LPKEVCCSFKRKAANEQLEVKITEEKKLSKGKKGMEF